MEPAKTLTVYYDGACPICSREIDVYRGCAGAERIDWVDVGTTAVPDRIAGDLSKDQARARFHVRAADGTLVSGAAGFAALWRALPAWRWLGGVASVAPVTWLLERLYRGFLVLRRR